MSTFLDKLKSFITETEADVVLVVAKIKQEIAVVESELIAADHWIVSNGPTIAADVEAVLGFATQIGVAANPEFALAVKGANVAVAALDAYVNSRTAGATTAQAVVDGYVAVKQAQAASANASAAAASTPVPKATP